MDPVLTRIQTILSRGESVQVVGLPGMAKSRLARKIPGIYLDTNLLIPRDLPAFLNHFAANLGLADLSTQSSQLCGLIASRLAGQDSTIVIDSLNVLLTPDFSPLFVFLKALRDQNKYHLKYVFFYRGLTPLSASFQPLLDDLYEIASENIVFLPAIADSNLKSTILNDFSPDLDFTPSPHQITDINHLSGGIPALVKIVMQSLRDHLGLDPHTHPRLKAQLEEIRLALGSSPNPQLLAKHGLTNAAGQLRSQLLADYLTLHSPASLSGAETHLLNLLQTHSGQILSKDQICEAVYPDVKNRAGISDHAIDQLIHRLREKVKNQYTLTTHRGLGYRLQPQ